MADHCIICDTRRPVGGTKILVLNGGALWMEFCPRCADTEITNAETGETMTVGALFARAEGGTAFPEEPFNEFNDLDATACLDDYNRHEENELFNDREYADDGEMHATVYGNDDY